jgi:hypothetical protein
MTDQPPPTITLAGKDWPIPELLVWRDLKKCRSELLELTARINAAVVISGDSMETVARLLDDLPNEDFDRLVMGPLLAAVQSLHPTVTRADFEAWPTTELERQFAWLKVRQHSGLFVFSKEAAPGEADGAPSPPSQTGTASSFAPADTSAAPQTTGGPT